MNSEYVPFIAVFHHSSPLHNEHSVNATLCLENWGLYIFVCHFSQYLFWSITHFKEVPFSLLLRKKSYQKGIISMLEMESNCIDFVTVFPNFYRWDFDATNPTAHAARKAFHGHVQTPATAISGTLKLLPVGSLYVNQPKQYVPKFQARLNWL